MTLVCEQYISSTSSWSYKSSVGVKMKDLLNNSFALNRNQRNAFEFRAYMTSVRVSDGDASWHYLSSVSHYWEVIVFLLSESMGTRYTPVVRIQCHWFFTPGLKTCLSLTAQSWSRRGREECQCHSCDQRNPFPPLFLFYLFVEGQTTGGLAVVPLCLIRIHLRSPQRPLTHSAQVFGELVAVVTVGFSDAWWEPKQHPLETLLERPGETGIKCCAVRGRFKLVSAVVELF